MNQQHPHQPGVFYVFPPHQVAMNQQHSNSGMYPEMAPYYTNANPTAFYSMPQINNGSVHQQTPPQENTVTYPSVVVDTQEQDNIQVPLQQEESCPRRGRCRGFKGWRKCMKQKRFLRALPSKGLTRIPRAVITGAIAFFLLSLVFLFTFIHNMDDLRRYKKQTCTINTHPVNLKVHFDYDHRMYYVNLNVSVSGPEQSFDHYNGADSMKRQPNHQQPDLGMEEQGGKRPPYGMEQAVDRSTIMSKVCVSDSAAKTTECRDYLLVEGSLTCFVGGIDKRHRGDSADKFQGKPEQPTHQEGRHNNRFMGYKHQGAQVHHNGRFMEHHGRATREIKSDHHQRPGQDSRETLEQPVPGCHGKQRIEAITVEQMKERHCREMRHALIAFVVLSVVVLSAAIFVGMRKLEDSSKYSFRRFFRQYLVDPFKASGATYQIDEVSSSTVVLQDSNEPKRNALLSASTLGSEEMPPCMARRAARRAKSLLTLFRHTATEPNETLLLYEKVARTNMCCKPQSKRRALRVLGRIVCGLLIAAVVIAIPTTFISGLFSVFSARLFKGFGLLEVSLVLTLAVVGAIMCKKRNVHYYITNTRLIVVEEYPLGNYRMRYVTFDKMKSVSAKGNKISITFNKNGIEHSGIMFHHVLDPTFVVNLIQQHIPQTETELQEQQPATQQESQN